MAGDDEEGTVTALLRRYEYMIWYLAITVTLVLVVTIAEWRWG